MSDRPSTDPTTGVPADGSTPPPAPWWSSPEGAWGAPSRPATDTRAYGAPDQPAQPPYGEAAYGQHGYGTSGNSGQGSGGPVPVDGEPSSEGSRGGSYAFPPPGSYREAPQNPWGAPVDPAGRTDGKARRGLGLAAVVLATALVAGGVGGVVGSRSGGDDGLLDPTASLGSSSTAPAVEREPGSVAAIAAEVLKSTVSIAVQSPSGSGTGSGVVIRSDGYVLTNNHVVESAKDGGQITVTVNSSSSRELPAEIVGLDPETDLAVLKVRDAGQLKPAALGQSRDLVVGDPVIAIGSPLGLAGTVTTGIVSALNRSPAVPGPGGTRTFLANAVQTDAAINPGNSGGALVNARGEVVGINSAIATLGGSGGPGAGSGSIGIGFAIPIDEARDIAEEIIRTGRVTHPAIGVEASTVTRDGRREGARISAVAPGGGAERAGLQSGDVIVQVEDTDVTSVDELILAVRQYEVGEQVEITYLRDGERRTATATLQDKRQR